MVMHLKQDKQNVFKIKVVIYFNIIDLMHVLIKA